MNTMIASSFKITDKLIKFCDVCSLRCSSMGNRCVSSCRCWCWSECGVLCSFLKFVSDASGGHMMETY